MRQGRAPHRATVALVAFCFTSLQAIPPAFAAQFTVFRKTYVRDADSPDTVTDTFPVLNAGTTWQLRAINGSLEDTSVEKVSSSTLFINGGEVLGASQFSQNVSRIEVPVTLQTTNAVATQLRSKPGGQLAIEITGQDNLAPTLQWLLPSNGTLTNSATLATRLQLADDIAGLNPASLVVRLDGTPVTGEFAPALAQPVLAATLDATLTPTEGAHTLRGEVKDLAGQSAAAEVSFTVDRTPPVISDLAPADGAIVDQPRPAISANFTDALSGIVGTTVQLLLDGADLTAQATVSETAVQFTAAADLPDGAHAVNVHVSDRAGNAASAAWSFSVETAPPITPTTAFIHGLVINAQDGQPLPDVRVTARETEGAARTDQDGRFQFTVPGTGDFLLTIEREGFTSSQRPAHVLDGRDTVVESVRLTPLDPQVTHITPEAGGLATDSTGDFELQFPPGSAPHAMDVRVTPLIHDEDLPGPIAPSQGHVLAVYFEPRFTTFDQPATLRARNMQNLPSGTEVNFQQWDEEHQTWTPMSPGHVTPDGAWIEFPVVRFFCWYCAWIQRRNPDKAASPNAEQTQAVSAEVKNPALGCEVENNSSICPQSGRLSESHTVPAIRTFGQAHNLAFTYRSLAADPSALIGTDYVLNTTGVGATRVPDRTSATISIEGRRMEASFQGADGKTRQGFLWDGRNARGELVPTGAYPYTVELTNEYTATLGDTGVAAMEPTRLKTTVRSYAMLVNERASSLGAGWSLEGLEQLHNQPDGAVLLTSGDGTTIVYRPGTLPDLASASFTGGFLRMLNGNGDGTFQSIQDASLGNAMNGVTVGDLNNDGLQDLAVALGWQNRVGVLWGTGFGALRGPDLFAMGSNPYAVAIADFNSDGAQDLMSSSDEQGVYILMGRGDGTFLPVRYVPVGRRIAGLVAADFNRDGALDGIIASPLTETLVLLLGKGDGTFQSPRTFSGGGANLLLATADLDQDTALDLIVPNMNAGTLSVLLGNGDGTFQPPHATPLPDKPFSAAIGDVNGDGIADAAVTRRNVNQLAVLLGNGDGTFQPPLNLATAGGPYHVIITDVNVDDQPDLAVSTDVGEIDLFIGVGDGTFEPVRRISIGGQLTGLAAIELNHAVRADGTEYFNSPAGELSRLERLPDGTAVRSLRDGTRVLFDTEGRHAQTVDRNGNATRYQYDAHDRVSRVEFPGDAAFDLGYASATGRLASIADSAGRLTRVTVDAAGDLREIVNPDGTRRTFVYDAEHRLLSQTDARGEISAYAYGAFGRITEAIGPEREVFNPETGLVIREHAVTRIAPSELAGLINDLPEGTGTPEQPAAPVRPAPSTIEDAAGLTTRLSTDRFGAPIEIVDPLLRTTKIERDMRGFPARVTRPNGSTVKTTFDPAGNPLSVTEESVSPALTTSFTYEPRFNQVTQITDPKGNATRIQYDDRGNPVRMTDAAGSATAITYDSHGLVTTVVDPLGTVTPAEGDHETRFAYDPLTGNLLSTTDARRDAVCPAGCTSTLSYDAYGHVATATDAAGHVTRFAYDAMGRLTEVRDAEDGVTRYAYDEAGNLTGVTDANGHISRFAYDPLNQLSQTVDPDGGIRSFAYDVRRNLSRLIDAKNQAMLFEYDGAGQLVHKALPDDQEERYRYDALGSLLTAAAPGSTIEMRYDVLGRLTSSSTSIWDDDQTLILIKEPITISSEDVSFDGATLVIDGATVTMSGRHRFASVTLIHGAVLTHAAATSGTTSRLALEVDGQISVDATSRIDVSGKGYVGALTSGLVCQPFINPPLLDGCKGRTLGNVPGSSIHGSYGGMGVAGGNSGSVNPIYGDFRQPTDLGSGGGSICGFGCTTGGNGGGALQLTADTLLLDGTIRANGAFGQYAYLGGSGGSIWVTVRRIAGSGLIEANGLEAGSNSGSGGGRVALYYEDAGTFDLTRVRAIGRNPATTTPLAPSGGGAGTVFLKSTVDASGRLIINNGGLAQTPRTTFLRAVGSGSSTALEAHALTNTAAAFRVPNPATGELGLIGLELNPNGAQAKTFTIINNTATMLFTDPADGDMTAIAAAGNAYSGVEPLDALTISGKTSVTLGDFLSPAAVISIDGSSVFGAGLIGGSTQLANSATVEVEQVSVPSLALNSGSVLTHPATTSTRESHLEIRVTGPVSLDATSKIDVSKRGYLTGGWFTPGYTLGNTTVGGAGLNAGGSHGGVGTGSSNVPYGDFRAPTNPGAGSGGAFYPCSGCFGGGGLKGGGVVRLSTQSLTVEGMISADGEAGGYPGGAGGSIWITTGSIQGNGHIQANGGNGASLYGAGGGGRVAIDYDAAEGFDFSNVSAAGGAVPLGSSGGAGTVFLKRLGQQHGDLIIDNRGVTALANSTPLRAIGAGTSTALAPWVLTNAAASFRAPNSATGEIGLIGLELNPDTAQGQTFTVVDNTSTTLTVDAADGDLTAVSTAGRPYIGAYTFDNLSVIRGASMTTQDRCQVLETLATTGGSVTCANLTQVGVLPEPAATRLARQMLRWFTTGVMLMAGPGRPFRDDAPRRSSLLRAIVWCMPGESIAWASDTPDTSEAPAVAEASTVDAGDPSYTYDANSNRLTMVDPSGTTTYTYDTLNRLKTVSRPGSTVTATYDALSRRTRLALPNGLESVYAYDDASQVLSLTHRLIALPATLVAQATYAYDALGNRTSFADQTGVHSFLYDPLSRLTQATHPALSGLPEEHFAYDAVGNRLSSHVSASYAYDDANRLQDEEQCTYTFDANGNLTSRTLRATGAVTRYTYSAENQLTRIDFADGTFAAYRYDALGRRIEKRLGETSLTRYGYDQEDLLLELTQLGTVQARWTHGPGIDEPWLLERDLNQNGSLEASERFTYHTDALGSVVALTNSTGQVVERYRYSSFGEPTIRSPGADGLIDTPDDTLLACSAYGNPFLFTGREYDCESGLYYYRARYYDPTTGRFLQEDPLWSPNLYPYVENNPVNYTDPTGEFLTLPLEALVLLVFAGGAAALLSSQMLSKNWGTGTPVSRRIMHQASEEADSSAAKDGETCPKSASERKAATSKAPQVERELVETVSQPMPLGMERERLTNVPPPNSPWWFRAAFIAARALQVLAGARR